MWRSEVGARGEHSIPPARSGLGSLSGGRRLGFARLSPGDSGGGIGGRLGS